MNLDYNLIYQGQQRVACTDWARSFLFKSVIIIIIIGHRLDRIKAFLGFLIFVISTTALRTWEVLGNRETSRRDGWKGSFWILGARVFTRPLVRTAHKGHIIIYTLVVSATSTIGSNYNEVILIIPNTQLHNLSSHFDSCAK